MKRITLLLILSALVLVPVFMAGAGTIQSGARIFIPADNSVDSTKIADGSIIAIDLSTGCVTRAKLSENAVGAFQIGEDSVGTAELAPGCVDSATLSTDFIDSTHIQGLGNEDFPDDIIDARMLRQDFIDSTFIVDNSLGTEDYAPGSVDSVAIAGSTVYPAHWYDTIGDTLHLGPWVKIPDAVHWTADGRGGASNLGNLQVFATKAPKAGAAMYGVHVYADTTTANFPPRLLNLVANHPTGGTTTSFKAQRIKVNIECSVGDPATGLSIFNEAGQNMWGLEILQPQADSASACNIYSKITNLVADKDGKTALNIYTDGGHIKLLDGDTEIESLYVDLDHIVFDSDSIDIQGDTTFVGAKVRIPNEAEWYEAALHITAVKSSWLSILAKGENGIYIMADSTTGQVPQKVMQIVQPASGATTASQSLLELKSKEVTTGNTTGLLVDFDNGVTGYPIRIDCDNTDTGTHANIYSTISSDNGASWNIYADGGRNYFGNTVEIADTLKLTSAKVCGLATLAAGAGGAGDDSVQVTTDIVKADKAKAHIFLEEADDDWTGSARIRIRWDGGFTVESTADEAGDRQFHWFVICDP